MDEIMKTRIEILPNQAKLELEPGSAFWVKPSLLRGVLRYDWGVPPPHPWGSPFLRIYHGVWILKRVEAMEQSERVSLYGSSPRGNFHELQLKKGERCAVAVRCLAGFSGDLHSIHTRIKLGPAFWLLRDHFFCVMEGAGTVLLYSQSALEVSGATEFQPTRIVAFDAGQRFRPVAPQPRRWLSQIINIFFSHEIIWQFEISSQVVAESCSEMEDRRNEGPLRRFFKHLLGFLKV